MEETNKNQAQTTEDARRLKAIFDTTVDGIITINRQGIIEECNLAAARMFGYKPEEMINHNVSILMPEPHQSKHDGYIQNYQTTRKAKIIGIGREVEGQRKDGSTFPLRLGVSEVILDDSTVIYTGVIHDLTVQKEIENQIKKLNENLEERINLRTDELSNTVNKLLTSNKKLEHEINERKKAEEALRESKKEISKALEREKELGQLKTRFVTMASHEFRTPLSTILSSTSLIDKYIKADLAEKSEKHIDRIKSSVTHLTSILNDVLSLSKLEEGKEDINPEPFIMTDLCTDVINSMNGMIKEGQEIKHTGINESTEVVLDQKLLRNILFNLLSNAIKYSPEGKTIYCQTEISDKLLKISIQDQGIGIPKEDQEHLFSRFFRATNASNIQGTGLGLNIVKKYLDLMGGGILFESEEGKGTRFDIAIPLNK